MEGCDFEKRALQHVKNYEKGQYSYFQLLNIKNVFQHYIELHQSLWYTSSIYYTTQNNPWICRYRFNGKDFWFFFCITPHTRKIKKRTVEFHTCTSKNILKMIKQRNQSCQVLFYISNTHLYTLVCRFHANKEVYWFLNRPSPFPPRTPSFWQMMVSNP